MAAPRKQNKTIETPEILPIAAEGSGLDLDNGLLEKGFSISDYSVVGRIGYGGSGETYLLSHQRFKETRVAKVYFPFFQLKSELRNKTDDEHRSMAADSILVGDPPVGASEFVRLLECTHPFIAKAVDRVPVTIHGLEERLSRIHPEYRFKLREKNYSTSAMIAEFIPGDTLQKRFKSLQPREAIQALKAVCEALDYLHTQRGLLHSDIKATNILIRANSSYPALIDFGLAKPLFPDDSEADRLVFAGIDESYLSERLTAERILEISEANRRGISLRDFVNQFWWIDHVQLAGLIRQLLDGNKSLSISREGQDLTAFVDTLLQYPLRAVPDFGQLSVSFDRLTGNPYNRLSHSFNLTNNVKVEVDDVFLPVVDHRSFTRLHRVYQLSLIAMTRDVGAIHTRGIHSLHTFKMCDVAIAALERSRQFRLHFTEREICWLRLAALLHDINHFPLLHVIQESGVAKSMDWITYFLGSGYLEQIGAPGPSLDEILTDNFDFRSSLLKAFLAYPETQGDQLSDTERQVAKSLGPIISSAYDVDKISYLFLDQNHTSADFGVSLDPEVLASVFKLSSPTVEFQRGVVSIPMQERHCLDRLLAARRQGFEKLYWSPDNRIRMAVVLEAIGILTEGKIDVTEIIRSSVDYGDFYLVSRLLSKAGEVDETFSVSAHELYALDPGAYLRLDLEVKDLDANQRHHLRQQLRAKYGIVNPLELIIDVPGRKPGLGGEFNLCDEKDNLLTGPPHVELSRNLGVHNVSATSYLYRRVDHSTAQQERSRLHTLLSEIMPSVRSQAQRTDR